MELKTAHGSLLVLALTFPMTTTVLAAEFPAAHPSATVLGQASISDPQIAEIINVERETGMKLSQAAVNKVQDSEVKDFVNSSLKELDQRSREAKQLFDRQGIQAQESDASKALRDDGQRDIDTLQRAPEGMPFDTEFVKLEIVRHQALVDGIDTRLLPSAQNNELKTYLQTYRMQVMERLDEAKRLLDHLIAKA